MDRSDKLSAVRPLEHVAALTVLLTLAGLCSSCTSTNYVTLPNQKAIDPKTDGQYEVTGYVHGRYWTTCLFYGIPLGSDLDEKTGYELNNRSMGDLGAVSLHTENYTINPAIAWAHYGGFFPFIIGSKCNYVSGTYVMPRPLKAATEASK